MALFTSSVAQVCRAFAQQLAGGINGNGRTLVQVRLGSPAAAAPAEGDEDHRLNLFFFRFETSNFDAGVLPGEPWLLRTHCLATPFCVNEVVNNNGTTLTVPAGENDLRVIGEVLRHYHEHPVFELDVDGEPYLIQTVFLNLGLEQLNQLWSTQGDVVYRPSVLFEVSLAPVIPQRPAIAPPLTGAVTLGVRADPAAAHLPPPLGLPGNVPAPPVMAPDTTREDWTPALCLVVDGVCTHSLSLEVGGQALQNLAPQAWVAGLPGAVARLRWDIWDAAQGWRAGPDEAAFAIVDARIDPDAVAAAHLRAVSLPFDDHAGQAMLYVERSYRRAADGVAVTLRGNPVLVSLHGGP